MANAALIATAKVRPGSEPAFAEWQARHALLLTGFPGYVSGDMLPPSREDGTEPWTLILHFSSETAANAWQHSAERGKSIAEVAPLLESGVFGETLRADSAQAPTSEVTEVVFSRIKPGMDARYRDWTTRIQAAQASYPGYRGMYIQPPAKENGENRWTSIFRYDTAAHLEAWMNSPKRRELLVEAREFIETEELMRVHNAFPGWIPLNPMTGESPPNWKAALLVLLGLFPIVMLEMKYLDFSRLGLQTSPAVFLGNTISVALTSFITMPLFVRWFGWWLFPKADPKDISSRRTIDLKGILIISLLFAAEVAVLWKLLP